MIKLVIFDLWRTLIPATIDFTHLFSLLKEMKIEIHEFVVEYEDAVQKKKYNNFEELRKDFFEYFKQYDNDLLEQELYEIYHNRFDKIYYYSEVESTLKKLKKEGYKLALMSNTESLRQKDLEEKLKLKEYFDFLGYSFEIGAIKPDSKTFQTVLSHFDVNPNEVIMVGDSYRSDVGGAQGMGFHNCLIEHDNIDKKYHPSIKPEFKITKLDEIFRVLGVLNEKSK
ncbi:MAG: HAD family hydrolase [Candidatus Diapherotrites archaeon]|jgi:2-haloalkanoic acid dehalogenase type II|uniref:HAD family hydrolase n=1 Tax=Candidatus Iainarchaeum sp. TaxID=3101447 RepID=A0A8T5GFV4_9ARCH|nr:HAD family hydrolase [Candidatus Diapherotrites archaeon]MBT7241735.1 HAD family hydrolase [Candidatus Diapherotrites archaeon]